MSNLGMTSIFFVNKFSPDKKHIPFPISPDMTLSDILPELSKKFNIHMQNIALACQDSQVLTIDDYNLPIHMLIEKFGKTYDIIDRNIVGSEENDKSTAEYSTSLVDELIPEFGSQWINIGPKHSDWQKRIKYEIASILRYIEYLKKLGNEPWFKLVPSRNPAHKFLIWEGYILVPSRKEIKFDIVLLLTSDYPKICPRCFAEENILNYCGKLYFGNVWEQEGKKYIMICHDHMSETNAWKPTLGVAHFFIREVWIWWMAQQNFIIQTWDEIHMKK